MSLKIFNNSEGTALLISLALIALLTGVVIMSADRSSTDIELSFNQLHEEQSFYLAEAGLERAFAAIKADWGWRTGFYNEPLGDGLYSVAVVDSTSNAGLGDTILLRSTAAVMTTVANIEMWVVPDYFNPYRYAAFGDDSLVMRNTSCTDSYNSDSGNYSSTLINSSGSVGSNGLIKMTNSAVVNGNATTSISGGILNDNSSIISGDTSTSTQPREMDMISDSEYDWAKSVSNAPSGLGGEYSYDPWSNSLSLSGDDTLTLTSGVYYFSSISVGEQSSIQLAPGAEVTVYITGNLTLNQGSSLNPGGAPSDFLIYSNGSVLNINQGTEFRAGFWGPYTTIKIEQNTDVYGSLTGKSIRIVNSACVHYDRSLSKFIRSEIEDYEQAAWRQL